MKNCESCKYALDYDGYSSSGIKKCSYPLPELPLLPASLVEAMKGWQDLPMDNIDGHLCQTYEVKS